MPTKAVCPPHLFYFLPLVLSGLSRDSEQQLIHPVALTVTCEVLQCSAPDSQVPRFMNAHLWSEFELSIVSLI